MKKIIVLALLAIGFIPANAEQMQMQSLTIASNSGSYSTTFVNNVGMPKNYKLGSLFADLGGAATTNVTLSASVSYEGKSYVVDTASILTNNTRISVDFDMPAYVYWGQTVTVTRASASGAATIYDTNLVYKCLLVLE